MAVFVLDRRKRPLMPCSEKRARKLLACGRARVHRLAPFSIRIIDRTVDDCTLQPLTLKIDPGSRHTGFALVRECESIDRETGEITTTTRVLNLFELTHRGCRIGKALTARRQMRRARRSRKTRYRAPRFLNRTKPPGWLAPSLQHRVDTTRAWVDRLRRLAPVSTIRQELVRFDMQRMDDPEIAGVEYQQGTLAGFEVREYLLEKWRRTCAYCGAKAVPLQIEHIHPKANGGSNRTRLDTFGFPRGYLTRKKRIHGFQTGDRVIAMVPTGKKAGVHIGRVAVRASGSFNLQTVQGVIQGISHRYCKVVQRADGYGYIQAAATTIPPRPEGRGFSRRNG